MEPVEINGVVDESGHLTLSDKLPAHILGDVRVFVVNRLELDGMPVEEIRDSLARSLRQAKNGERLPLSRIWEGVGE